MKQKGNILRYGAGFILGLSCISFVGYAVADYATEGGIGVLFSNIGTTDSNGNGTPSRPGTLANPYRLHGENIQDNTVTSAELLDGSIRSEDIEDDTIQSVDIKNGTIRDEDIHPDFSLWNKDATTGDISYSDGKVGIGTTSPEASMHIKSSTPGSLSVFEDPNGKKWFIGGASTGSFGIWEDTPKGEDAVLGIDEGGDISIGKYDAKVGIGTETPTAKLDVNGDAKINGMTVGRGSSNDLSNLVVGDRSFSQNENGIRNTAIGGAYVLNSNTTGTNNTSIGFSSMTRNISGSSNTALGVDALNWNLIGSKNTAIGLHSLVKSTGNKNTAVGHRSFAKLQSGDNNLALGEYAGEKQKSGDNNIAIGHNIQLPDLEGSNQLNIANLIFGNSGISKSVTINGNTNINKNLTVKGDTTNEGNTLMKKNLTVKGDTSVSGDITVKSIKTSTTQDISQITDNDYVTKKYVDEMLKNMPEIQKVECTGSGYKDASCTATCPEGTKIISGGCQNNARGWKLISNQPNENNGWNCRAGEDWGSDATNKTITGYAMCATLSSGNGNSTGNSTPSTNNHTWYNTTNSDSGNVILDSTGKVGVGTDAPSQKFEVAGNIKANGYFYTSDEKLKENIFPIKSAITTITKLRGVTFDWKATKKASLGFIAQEVEKVLPELVHTDGNGYKSVEYANIVALLVEGMKQQQKKIEELETKVDKLQKQIDEITAQLTN